MNALEASKSMKTRSSAAYLSELSVGAEPMQVLRFRSAISTDETFREALIEDPSSLLDAAGLDQYQDAIEQTGVLERDDYVLSEHELEMFLELRDQLEGGGVLAQEDLERNLAYEGYGLPAIVVVVVVAVAAVAVAVAVK
jgi:hypothetical protein